MNKDYQVYFDSGTSNSRIYLLNRNYDVLYTDKRNIGSKDSAAAGDNLILIQSLKEMYDIMLSKTGVSEADIEDDIWASGMLTSPYGFTGVPHMVIPASAEEMANAAHRFHEDKLFHRDFILVLGLKTVGDTIEDTNNMRGEEIEIIGVMDTVEEKFPNKKVALFLPGSHTHIALVKNSHMTSILSNMAGELFYAIKSSTVLAPVLSAETEGLDEEAVRQGLRNLQRYGLNRAIYICHAMRIFENGTPLQRKSYAEGVLNGGFAQALEYYCENVDEWKDCDTAVCISNEYWYRLYCAVLENHPYIKHVEWLPISKEINYNIEGLRKMQSCRKDG